MTDPIFWLALSLFLVAISLTAVLVVAIPTLIEISRAARSAERLFDALEQEFPPTLESIRLTGLELTELTGEVQSGVKTATRVTKQVEERLNSAKKQVETAQVGSRRLVAGVKAAWQTWRHS